MTSRERVRKLIRKELTGSYCISTGGMPNDAISVYAYAKLLDRLGMKDRKIRVYDLLQYIPVVDADVADRLGGDFVHAERPRFRFDLHRGSWRPGMLEDGTPVYFPEEFRPETDARGGELIRMNGEPYARRPKNGLYFDIVAKPLADAETPEDLKLIHPAAYMSEADVAATVAGVEELYRTTDKSIILLIGGQHIEQGQRDFGFENFYCNLLEEPELMHAYFRMLTDSYLDTMERILSRCGDKVDVVWFCDDLGTQNSLQMSLPTFRSLIKPYKKEMFDYIHQNHPDTAVLYHSCGAVFNAIPDFIEMGADMLNPVQISAAGMDPEKLVKAYGRDIIFWGGGLDTQSMKPEDTVQDILDRASRLLDVFAAGGNYVFTQVHNFQADTDPAKIEAFYGMARDRRKVLEGLL